MTSHHLQPFADERNSLANVDTWKTRLTPDEIERVKERVWDVSRRFYSEREW